MLEGSVQKEKQQQQFETVRLSLVTANYIMLQFRISNNKIKSIIIYFLNCINRELTSQ